MDRRLKTVVYKIQCFHTATDLGRNALSAVSYRVSQDRQTMHYTADT
jgi:hypothetical protein